MIRYSIYQGLGNNFIFVDYEDVKTYSFSSLALSLCFGNENKDLIDGLIIVKQNPLTMIFYNQDGSIGTMCGNGIRCFIHYCYDHKIINNLENIVLTKSGEYYTKIISVNPFMVLVNMKKPLYTNDVLELNTSISPYLNIPYEYKNITYYINVLYVGTIHTVIFVSNLDEIKNDLKFGNEIGYYFCHLPLYKDRSNVDFVEVVNRNLIKVLTYERGVGFTLACGTGACASTVISKMYNYVDDEIEVLFEQGSLSIKIIEDNIYMIGPSEKIIEGQIEM